MAEAEGPGGPSPPYPLQILPQLKRENVLLLAPSRLFGPSSAYVIIKEFLGPAEIIHIWKGHMSGEICINHSLSEYVAILWTVYLPFKKKKK